MKLFKNLFKQTPEQSTQQISRTESEKKWEQFHSLRMSELSAKGVKKRDLYGWS
ncbi:hypothetical protein [Streptococcus thoraltensis]|uniref:hypothetical protein n=1 Tax=Streptococcus thoraltensis TaxID=55085 RepID=UPI001F55C8FB|nr:hypothetical protein [Streptococcus thoraltensis]